MSFGDNCLAGPVVMLSSKDMPAVNLSDFLIVNLYMHQRNDHDELQLLPKAS